MTAIKIEYREALAGFKYWAFLGILGVIVLAGLGACYYMEHNGHFVTGMNNQIVWGIPHVFAVFLIVAASGALNVASIGSVFGKTVYKPLARLSGLLAISLLAGGLAVLVLDLGRPDRLIVAMFHYNFKSIFAWNIILYSGFFGVVIVYLWTMMDRSVGQYNKLMGFFAFTWRLILTTGTGSIFGFLVAREAYNDAIMAPMFIAMSFAFGLAIFNLVIIATYGENGRPIGEVIPDRLRKLLGIFIAAMLYFVAVQFLTKSYTAEHNTVAKFILFNGGIFASLFWMGQIILGGLLPLLILFAPPLAKSRAALVVASLLVIVGGICQIYVIIIGGQAFPTIIFPGMEVTSTFFDGQVNAYNPTLAEMALGVSGFAIALLLVTVMSGLFRFLPASLADGEVDPHSKK